MLFVIYEWTNEYNGVLIKSERDTYVYIFEQKYLEKIKEDKFSILDKIKDSKVSSSIFSSATSLLINTSSYSGSSNRLSLKLSKRR